VHDQYVVGGFPFFLHSEGLVREDDVLTIRIVLPSLHEHLVFSAQLLFFFLLRLRRPTAIGILQ